MSQTANITFADLFRNSEESQDYYVIDSNGYQIFSNEKEGFPLLRVKARLGIIDSANENSNIDDMTGNEEILNYFYLLMYYKIVPISKIELISPANAKVLSVDINSISEKERDNYSEELKIMIKNLKKKIENSKKLILFPMTTEAHWCLAYRRPNNTWKIMDSSPEVGVTFAKKVLEVLDIKDAVQIQNLFNQNSVYECGIYTILYMLAVSTMSDEEIQNCRTTSETKDKFLTNIDFNWINLEIKKLYNLRYQADNLLKGEMKQIVVSYSDQVTEDEVQSAVSTLKKNLKNYNISTNGVSVYADKSKIIQITQNIGLLGQFTATTEYTLLENNNIKVIKSEKIADIIKIIDSSITDPIL